MPFRGPGGPPRKKKAKAKAAAPSKHERAEHAGRVPQPGVPSGPRQTVPQTPAQKKKHKQERARARAAKKPGAGFVLHPGVEHRGPVEVTAHDIETAGADWWGRAKEHAFDTPDVPGVERGSAADNAISTFMLASGGEGATVKALSAASDAPTAAKAGKAAVETLKKGGARLKAAPGKKLARVKSAPKRAVAKAKATPKKVKTAPRRAKKAVSTKEGRRAAAKGGAKKAAKHPVRTGYGALVAYPEDQLGSLPGEPGRRADAFAQGHIEALAEEPGKTLKTTARAIPGIVAAPAAILGSAGTSALHGTTKPLTTEVSKQAGGLKEVGEKLFSGDPETVKKTVEDEVGLSFVAPLPALSRVRETKFYKGKRGAVRAKVASKREGTRATRRAELRDYKTGARAKKPRKIRHAVIDTATGEERILRRAGKVVEGHRQRKGVATSVARHKGQGEREGLLASKAVVKALRRSKLTGGRIVRRDLRGHDVGDVVATVATYGLSRNKDKALRQLDDIAASIGKAHPDELPAGTITDLANVKWLRDHQDKVFKDKPFWESVDAYKRQAREIEHSGRKKVLAISDVYGHARPEEILESGVKVRGRTVKTNFYKNKETLERKQAELSELRADAKLRDREAAKARTPEERARFDRLSVQMSARAKKLERDLKDYRAGYKQAQKIHYREAQATIRNKGYEQPAYVKDVKPRQGLEAGPAFPGGRSARKQHMAGMEQSRRGSVIARDFDTLVHQSVMEPRIRRAMHRATTQFVEEWAHPVKGKRYLTSEEISRAINRGELDETQYAVLHSQFFKQAILDPYKEGEKFTDEVRASLGRSISAEVADRATDSGNKYVVVPKEALREFIHQMEPPKGMDKIFGGANRLLSRVILGYSPSWAAAQLVAEGIPAALSVGANPARLARVAKFIAKEDRELSRKDRAVIDGTVGETAGVTPHPQIQLKPDTNLNASRFFRLSERNRIGRALLKGSTGEALGAFNRYTGGKYRKAVLAAKADRELNGFVRSLSELMRGQRTIAEAIKGKPLKVQMEYIARHPKEAARLESYLDDVMGNWRALTRHEAKLAPLIVFYPFVRYSLRWTFWSFPKRHPVKASILYFLSQQNAEELEKLAGGPPSSPLDYTFPVYTGSTGKNAVLPGGSRVAPGMNAITTAIGKGQIEGLAGALNPAIGIGISAITGVDPFTGEKVASSPLEHALLGLNQLLSLPTPVRTDLPVVGNIRDRILELAGEDEQSGVSKAFDAMDENRNARSFALPFLPQSGERYGDSARLARALDEAGSNPELGDDEVSAALEAVKRGDFGPAKRLQKQRESGDKASDVITALVEEYVGKEGALPKLSDKQYEWLGRITGKRVFPYEQELSAEDKLNKKLGLPSAPSKEDLDKQLGIPSAPSVAELDKQLGIGQ